MSRYVDLSNPKIFHNGRDKYGNGIYHIPPDLPTDDAVERKKGKWHKRFYPQIEMMVCSECQEEFSYDAETGIRDYNYCPSCGADMAERKEE